jgi:hypothetical protein
MRLHDGLKRQLVRFGVGDVVYAARLWWLSLEHSRLPLYVFLSYPKSGRTWVRFMVDDYLARYYRRNLKNVFLAEKDLVVGRHHRILYTHFTDRLDYYDMGSFEERSTLVPRSHCVLLTRNIYATLASSYHGVRYRYGRDFTPSEFLRRPRVGAMKIISFYNLWVQLQREFLTTRVFSYETLRADTRGVFPQVLEALGIPLDLRLAEEVVEGSSFERLRELSESEAYRGTRLAPTDPANPKSYKVREAKPDGFRSVFSDEDVQYIKRVIDDVLLDKTVVDTSLPGQNGQQTGG